jgi:hypothetical protein
MIIRNAFRVVTQGWKWYGDQLKMYPLTVKSLTSAGIIGLADIIAQNSRNTDGKIDFRRVVGMSLYGCVFVGPFSHAWHSTLSKWIQIPSSYPLHKQVLSACGKVAVDQAVAAPIFTTAFFFSRGCIDGHNIQGILANIKRDFLRVFKAGMMVWPSSQFVNLFFIHPMYRVLFSNVVGLCWSTFMSISACRSGQMRRL